MTDGRQDFSTHWPDEGNWLSWIEMRELYDQSVKVKKKIAELEQRLKDWGAL